MAGQMIEKCLTLWIGQSDKLQGRGNPRLWERKVWAQAKMTLLDMAEAELTHITREY